MTPRTTVTARPIMARVLPTKTGGMPDEETLARLMRGEAKPIIPQVALPTPSHTRGGSKRTLVLRTIRAGFITLEAIHEHLGGDREKLRNTLNDLKYMGRIDRNKEDQFCLTELGVKVLEEVH